MLIEHPDQMIVAPESGGINDLVVVGTDPIMRIHNAADCLLPCPFHGPTDHHMVTWPLEVGGITDWVAYRTCRHGKQHLDPDNHPPTLKRANIRYPDNPCEGWRRCCPQMCCRPVRIEVNGHSYYW